MANMNIEQMVEELSTWTVKDVAALVKALEEAWGVSAAPAAVAAVLFLPALAFTGSARAVDPGGLKGLGNTGSGSVEVRLGEAADVRITAQDVGSGSLTFRLPADSAVQLTVDDEGSGSIRTPRGLDRVKGRSGEDVGVWESKDYGRAERQVTIRVDDMGSGSVSLEWDR